MPRADIKLCITLIGLAVAATVWAKEAKQDAPTPLPVMSVQVNDAVVRDDPSFLSPIAATLNYGDKVGIVEKTEDWRRVKPETTSNTGWMHISALTEKPIKLEAGESDENVKASEQELAAGGRGFNKDVEDKFRKDHEDLDAAYRKLDQLCADPARQASLSQVIRFMREGELIEQEGGQ